jgi:hypothetical protein
MKKLICTLSLSVTVGGYAITVEDAGTHSLITQQTVQQIMKMQDQLLQAQEAVRLAQKARDLAGDPTQAVGLLGSVAGLGPEANDTGKAMSQLATMGRQGFNLSRDVQELYQPIDVKNPLNSNFNAKDPYAKYQAVEAAFDNYSSSLSQSQQSTAAIRRMIDEVNKRIAKTEAEQRQKQADLAALNAKLADAQKQSQDTFNQLQAQKILNDNEEDKKSLNVKDASDKRMEEMRRRTFQD